MKSLLTALQEGRLIELPDSDKEKSLEYLATIIEAIPDIGSVSGITESVLAREQQYNTGIGSGWACPHARSTVPGELLCSVGWSPHGIDYGSPDNAPVHLIVMYYVPDAQKNGYLKEISSLAKAIQTVPSMRELPTLTELSEVRHRLLDAISIAMESMTPDARARMIQLDVKQAAVQETTSKVPVEFAANLFPVQIICSPGARALALAQERELVQMIESQLDIPSLLDQHGRAEAKGFHIILRSVSRYQLDRVIYDCVAVKVGK